MSRESCRLEVRTPTFAEDSYFEPKPSTPTLAKDSSTLRCHNSNIYMQRIQCECAACAARHGNFILRLFQGLEGLPTKVDGGGDERGREQCPGILQRKRLFAELSGGSLNFPSVTQEWAQRVQNLSVDSPHFPMYLGNQPTFLFFIYAIFERFKEGLVLQD